MHFYNTDISLSSTFPYPTKNLNHNIDGINNVVYHKDNHFLHLIGVVVVEI